MLCFCFVYVMYVYVACFIGIFSKLRSLKLLSKPFDEQQFFVTEDEFEQTNNTTGDRNYKRIFIFFVFLYKKKYMIDIIFFLN
jgi:hypothetical protein